jgi:hypothetical protein
MCLLEIQAREKEGMDRAGLDEDYTGQTSDYERQRQVEQYHR